jgi:hypothetical protein
MRQHVEDSLKMLRDAIEADKIARDATQALIAELKAEGYRGELQEGFSMKL